MYLYIYIRFKCSDRNVTTVGFYLVEAKCEPRWKLIEKLPLIFYEHIPHSLISRSNTIKRLAKYFLTFISIRSVSRGVKNELEIQWILKTNSTNAKYFKTNRINIGGNILCLNLALPGYLAVTAKISRNRRKFKFWNFQKLSCGG